jgi:phytanoyl-CoA hydroxylase
MLEPHESQLYRDQGYLHVRGLLSRSEAADLRREAHALAARLTPHDATWQSVKGEGGAPARLTHCHDVQFHSAAMAKFLFHPQLLRVAQGIIGSNVQLHHTKMFIKPPERGAPFPLHQDYNYFPHANNSMIAVIVHFDDAPLERGCVCVVPGSHKLGVLPALPPDHHLPADQFPFERALPLPAAAGDAIFFSYLLVHGSGVNRSNEPRTTMLIQLRDPTDLPTIDRHVSRGQGMMLAGVDPRLQAPTFAWDKGQRTS